MKGARVVARVVPEGVSAGDILTGIEEIREAWEDRFIIEADEETSEPETFLLADDPRVVYTATAVYVKVSVPIHVGDKAILSDWLRIEEPTVGALKAGDRAKGEVGKAACILAHMLGAPASDIDKLKASDMVRISAIIGNFQ